MFNKWSIDKRALIQSSGIAGDIMSSLYKQDEPFGALIPVLAFPAFPSRPRYG